MTETQKRLNAVYVAAREYKAACEILHDKRLQANAILAAQEIAFGANGYEGHQADAWRQWEFRRIYRTLPGGDQSETERFCDAESTLISNLDVVVCIVNCVHRVSQTLTSREA